MRINIEKLGKGSHRSPHEGVCLLEAVAYVAGEPHTDRPQCVDPVLGAFGRALNDRLSDADRQQLLPLISRLVGTRGDAALSLRRVMLLVDGVVRKIVPKALDAAGLFDHAKALRALEEVKDEPSADAYDAADAARDADAAAHAADAAAYAARDAIRLFISAIELT